MASELRVLEFYSGIGGLHRALERCETRTRVVAAFDRDTTAASVYRANFQETPMFTVDINTLSVEDVKRFEASVWLMSPSCQPYTVLNSFPRDIEDSRAKSFLHLIMDVLPGLCNIGAGFEQSKQVRPSVLSKLRDLRYDVSECLLSPKEFGLPNSRKRYYLLARRDPRGSPVSCRVISDLKMPDCLQDKNGRPAIQPVAAYLEPHAVLEAEYSVPDQVLLKWGRLFDIVYPTSLSTCCFTGGYGRRVDGTGSILQMDVDRDTSSAFTQFAHALESGSVRQALDLLRPLQLRYFTPMELLRLFVFCTEDHQAGDSCFVWPDNVSLRTKYRLIGNSVNVLVVEKLLHHLLICP